MGAYKPHPFVSIIFEDSLSLLLEERGGAALIELQML